MEGLVIKVQGNKYLVKYDNKEILCNARGNLKKEKSTPVVGDIVEISNTENIEATIEKINIRKNLFIRPSVSNIDIMLLVVCMENPKTDLLVLDRQIIACKINNVEPIICINKTDISDKNDICEFRKIYKNSGIKLINISAKTRGNVDELMNSISGNIVAFSGNSGVGKSSILNMLFGKVINKEGNISEKLKRGRHTTKHTELFELGDDTYVVDTPGFSSLDMIYDLQKDNIKNCYEEFDGSKCKYLDCNHISEDGCEVIFKLNEGKINRIRYENYIKIFNEIKKKQDNKYR